jgi:putative restriction endonuclease
MKSYVGVTDSDWFELLRSQAHLDEVNFWQPGGSRQFRALEEGDLFLFKLHSPRNFIVGGGFFAHSSLLPVSLAWSAFGIANGARSLEEMRQRTLQYRRSGGDPKADFTIGCIMLTQPFFLPEDGWVAVPNDWSPNIVQGKGYDLSIEPGTTMYRQLRDSLAALRVESADMPRFGEGVIVHPRLGQGSFRIVVTDAYERRCALTGERVLPVLEAAHVKPYSVGGPHQVDNGLLLRSDLHTLFDRGYVTITEDLRVEVSKRIKEEFENGRDYYALHGHELRRPSQENEKLAVENIRWHNENVYLAA